MLDGAVPTNDPLLVCGCVRAAALLLDTLAIRITFECHNTVLDWQHCVFCQAHFGSYSCAMDGG